jgi:hypothetical protein
MAAPRLPQRLCVTELPAACPACSLVALAAELARRAAPVLAGPSRVASVRRCTAQPMPEGAAVTEWTQPAEPADRGEAAHQDEPTPQREAHQAEPVQQGLPPEPLAGVTEVLNGLDARPLAEHAEIYEELHSRLQRTLAEIDGG